MGTASAAVMGWDAQGNPIRGGWDAQGNPIGANALPAQQHLDWNQTVEQNPKGEGTYKFWNAKGQPVMVPYTNALDLLGHPETALGSGPYAPADRYKEGYQKAIQNGWTLDDGEVARLFNDYSADPKHQAIIKQNELRSVPGFVREAARTVTLGGKHGPQIVRDLANSQSATPMDKAEEYAETGAEFMGGEELLGALSKVTKAPVALADAAKIEQEIKKGTVAGRLFLSALRQGGIAGAQTYLKTGGDAGEALKSGAETAALSGATGLAVAGGSAATTAFKGVPEAPAVTRTVGGVEVPVPAEEAVAKATPTAQASSKAYANLSREAVEENMRKVSTSQSRVDELLNTTHDLTGAIDRQQELLKPAYDHLNQLSDGRFRELNKEVNDARLMAKSGKPEDIAMLQAKMSEMEALMDKASAGQGKLFSDYAANVKAAWRQNYILQDFGERWDRNLNGAPGASQVSNEQRGINGNGLMRDIQSAIRTYGRAHVEEGLGPGRLEQFEEIARLNQTNRQRKAFNIAVNEVAKELPGAERVSPWGKRAMAMTVGGAIAHVAGQSPYFGMVAGEAGYEGTRAVMNALKTNPRIAQNFTFALESGANPENFGPFIAAMIQKSREQQPQPEATTEDKQQ